MESLAGAGCRGGSLDRANARWYEGYRGSYTKDIVNSREKRYFTLKPCEDFPGMALQFTPIHGDNFRI